MPDHEIPAFQNGVHNLLSDEIIPSDAAQDASNWYTQDGKIKLIAGRLRIGTEGALGGIQGEIFGYKVDGTKVHWRKTGAKIQYYDGTDWQDTVTGLTLTADYRFTNYSSLAGTFTFAFGVDGIFKMHNANPASYCAMYDAAKNFKGFAFIDSGRAILWNRPEDKTGFYGSYIDRQNSTVYTSVAAEATNSLTGTLAFKAGAATRNCFGVTITLSGTGEVYTDNYLGVLTGTLGGTGTINYITGVYTLTNAGTGTCNYQWEDSNAKGVTDFTHSASRAAGEGFQFPQDEGGDAIQSVLIGQDGAYYSLKSQSAYALTLAADDTATGTSNLVYRRNMGVPFFRAAVSMQRGIVFINTANPERPELTLLERNSIGGEVEPTILFPQFKFANYLYDDCNIETYERYIIVFCKTLTATANDTALLCDLAQKTVDITSFSGRTSATDNSNLYIGSSITQTVYQLYTGFDDDGFSIDNFWTSKGESLIPRTRKIWPQGLKRHRRLRLKGHIDISQYYEVYVSYDDGAFQLAGTVRGDGSYVDSNNTALIGDGIVGGALVGGSLVASVPSYFMEMKLKAPKFRKRTIKFIAKGIGYVDIENMKDHQITVFEDKLPKRFRQKSHVSLDGTQDDLSTPEY